MALRFQSTRPSAVLLMAALGLSQPRSPARAEDSIAYKYETYREADGRIKVETQSGSAEHAFGADTQLKLTGTIDAIAGATPTGEPAPPGSDQVAMTQMHDRRKAWSGDLLHQFPRIQVDVGLANSRESDYVSTGGSVNTLTDFNQKNTTLLLGLAGTDDGVKVFYEGIYVKKRTDEAVVGVKQLLSPLTFVTFNLTYGRARGYLGDPYRVIQKSIQIFPGIFLPRSFPENRPDRREHSVAFASINHAVPPLHGALEASCRFYHDSFGTTSHTLGATWLQKIGERFVLSPSLRYYQQSAADFYRITLDGTSIVPGLLPNPAGPFYSADYRLAKLQTWDYALKAVWKVSEAVQFDAAVEHYEMQGRDGFTLASAFPHAHMVTLGVQVRW
ncbi:MAG TPA: DUF3570 domain-containing protein [Opitutaceae bacterium]|nr:DUF3570 domain-containing protein [Opitutaceae bacterium]